MNILNISLSDQIGGASIAGYRMHREFLNMGYNSYHNSPLILRVGVTFGL